MNILKLLIGTPKLNPKYVARFVRVFFCVCMCLSVLVCLCAVLQLLSRLGGYRANDIRIENFGL